MKSPCILILLCLNLYTLRAQHAKQKEDWFIIGYGQGYKYFDRDLSGTNFGGAYFFNNYKSFYQRYGLDVTYNPGYRRNLFCANASIGKQIKGKYLTFNINTGPSFYWGRDNNNKAPITLGLTASSGLYLNILPDVAIGVEAFTNANFIQSTHGFRICIMGMQAVR